jgi:hypothetical protein
LYGRIAEFAAGKKCSGRGEREKKAYVHYKMIRQSNIIKWVIN